VQDKNWPKMLTILENNRKKENPMYEELYQSIPDSRAYLARIQSESFQKADKESLDKLIYSHQCHIPFENLDVYRFHKPISLSIPYLFHKIVEQKRGGYCFELNGLFTQLLKDLGYHAYSCMCRIVRGKDFTPPVLHRGIIVTLDEKSYYCDVGYGGPMPAGAVCVEDGSHTTLHGETFHISQFYDGWWTLSRTTSEGVFEDILQFYLMPQEAVDFLTLSYYCSTNPDSVFTQKNFFNLRTYTGSINIVDHQFTRVENGKKENKILETQEELDQIVHQEFHIEW